MLDREEAAAWCAAIGRPVTPGSLAVFASRGTGPRYRKVGRKVYYEKDDLTAWAEGQTYEGPRTDDEMIFYHCIIAYREIFKHYRRQKRAESAFSSISMAAELAGQKLSAAQKKRIEEYADSANG